VRLFVALDVGEAIREQLRELLGRLREEYPDARWVRPEAIHVTLKFIGHVEADRVDAISEALGTVRSEQPVEVAFRGLGFFPNQRRPRLLWCGVEASTNLSKLASDIEHALDPLGIPFESRPFVAHLTLARWEPGAHAGSVAKLVQASQTLQSAGFGSVREIAFDLYQSVLKPSGAEYKRLRSFSFVKGSV
jgi:2'-5' RNA ligase